MHRMVQQVMNCSIPYKFEDTNIGNQETENERADNTVIYKALHRKLKIELSNKIPTKHSIIHLNHMK